ncbi:MAG: hypothetical protein ACRC7R_09915 [Sarcina sp.]
MFIKYEDITKEVAIDVRTITEFENMPLFCNNIPIINEKEHSTIKKMYPLALFIIVLSLYRNKKEIRKKLLKLSKDKKEKLIIACSRGRLRSPIVYLYARYLGIDCKILYKGIKGVINEKLVGSE